jgi:hypothetical protein
MTPTLAASGKLQGRVIRQDLGLLIGWTLRASPLDVGRPVITAIDSGTGGYRFSRLEEGRYLLELVAPDGTSFGPGVEIDLPPRQMEMDLTVRTSGALAIRDKPLSERTLSKRAKLTVIFGSLAVAAALLLNSDSDDPSASPSTP